MLRSIKKFFQLVHYWKVEMFYGIAACDPRGVMGKRGKLPWHCEEDLRHFSETISDHPVIMGYRTFASLPKKYFHQRLAIVFTSRDHLPDKNERLLPVSSLAAFFDLLQTLPERDFYLIGGAQLYELFLKENLVSEFILTEFKDLYEGDTFFPLSRIAGWPYIQVKETKTFTIRRYLNPLDA